MPSPSNEGINLTQALQTVEREVAEFFASLSPDEFTLRVDSAWTPAEHLEHLNTAVGAAARGLAFSPWLLRLRFGTALRSSRTYDEVRDDYRARLAAGAGATGRYVPAREEVTGDRRAVRQAEILARWRCENSKLAGSLQGWSERDLDRVRLPHPILGAITARELVYFTIYHGRHHITAARARIPRFCHA
jgi:hypothetical protein